MLHLQFPNGFLLMYGCKRPLRDRQNTFASLQKYFA